MARKKFILNLPFRQITKSDAKKQFENEFFELNHIALADLISANKKNQHVFVYDRNGDILAFLVFKDAGTHFHLELAETNRLFKTNLMLSRKLMVLIEELSRYFGYCKITLHSVVDKIPLYQSLGYKMSGRMILDPTYGKLAMMKKRLS